MEINRLKSFRFTTNPPEKGAPDALAAAKRLLSWSARMKLLLDGLEGQARKGKDITALLRKAETELGSFVADLERGDATGALYLIGDPDKIAKLELMAKRAGRALEKIAALPEAEPS